MRQVFLPGSFDELWEVMTGDPGPMIFAGGTDLFVRLRQGIENPDALVCLERIRDLALIRDNGDHVFIGAGSTHTQLIHDPVIQNNFPVLTKALSVLGSPPVRNMGTIGGNICTASPAGDTLPPLYALGAELEIRSKNSSCRIALKDFITGPGQTALKEGEILFGIRLKKSPIFNIHHFEKVGQRNALAISIVSLAALLKVSDSGLIEEARLAWGSVGPTVVTSVEVERALEGRRLSMESLQEAAPLARQAVSPIDDIRAGAAYRKTVAGNLLLRLAGYYQPGS